MPRPVANPPNPWLCSDIDWESEPPPSKLEVFEERARSALQENRSPDVGFRWSINPYRGCFHACAYCYARPTHEYLGWGAGTDFDRRIVVKANLPEVLAAELRRPRWAGETVVFSGNTDCYQPLEAAWRLTRRCLEVCVRHDNPVGVVTKGSLVARDLDLFQALGDKAQVFVSIPILDPELSRAIEPGASPPIKRLRALEALSDAGVPTGVMVSPMIPGLNDHAIPNILKAARDAGARRASMTLLRLPGSVRQVFAERIRETCPNRADKIIRGILEMRGGRMNDPRFGGRMRGSGERWQITWDLFRHHVRRLGFEERGLQDARQPAAHPRPPKRKRQLTLF